MNNNSTEKPDEPKKPSINIFAIAQRDRDPWGPVCPGCPQWGHATKGCSKACAEEHVNLPPWR